MRSWNIMPPWRDISCSMQYETLHLNIPTALRLQVYNMIPFASLAISIQHHKRKGGGGGGAII